MLRNDNQDMGGKINTFILYRIHLNVNPTSLTVHASRGFNSVNPKAHAYKFSVHLVIKHATHMFKCQEDLWTFISLLRQHPTWNQISNIVDMNVYNCNQQFRALGCCKAVDTKLWTLENDKHTLAPWLRNNILLPVCPESGAMMYVWPSNTKKPTIPLNMWMNHCITSFWVDVVPGFFQIARESTKISMVVKVVEVRLFNLAFKL